MSFEKNNFISDEDDDPPAKKRKTKDDRNESKRKDDNYHRKERNTNTPTKLLQLLPEVCSSKSLNRRSSDEENLRPVNKEEHLVKSNYNKMSNITKKSMDRDLEPYEKALDPKTPRIPKKKVSPVRDSLEERMREITGEQQPEENKRVKRRRSDVDRPDMEDKRNGSEKKTKEVTVQGIKTKLRIAEDESYLSNSSKATEIRHKIIEKEKNRKKEELESQQRRENERKRQQQKLKAEKEQKEKLEKEKKRMEEKEKLEKEKKRMEEKEKLEKEKKRMEEKEKLEKEKKRMEEKEKKKKEEQFRMEKEKRKQEEREKRRQEEELKMEKERQEKKNKETRERENEIQRKKEERELQLKNEKQKKDDERKKKEKRVLEREKERQILREKREEQKRRSEEKRRKEEVEKHRANSLKKKEISGNTKLEGRSKPEEDRREEKLRELFGEGDIQEDKTRKVIQKDNVAEKCNIAGIEYKHKKFSRLSEKADQNSNTDYSFYDKEGESLVSEKDYLPAKVHRSHSEDCKTPASPLNIEQILRRFSDGCKLDLVEKSRTTFTASYVSFELRSPIVNKPADLSVQPIDLRVTKENQSCSRDTEKENSSKEISSDESMNTSCGIPPADEAIAKNDLPKATTICGELYENISDDEDAVIVRKNDLPQAATTIRSDLYENISDDDDARTVIFSEGEELERRKEAEQLELLAATENIRETEIVPEEMKTKSKDEVEKERLIRVLEGDVQEGDAAKPEKTKMKSKDELEKERLIRALKKEKKKELGLRKEKIKKKKRKERKAEKREKQVAASCDITRAGKDERKEEAASSDITGVEKDERKKEEAASFNGNATFQTTTSTACETIDSITTNTVETIPITDSENLIIISDLLKALHEQYHCIKANEKSLKEAAIEQTKKHFENKLEDAKKCYQSLVLEHCNTVIDNFEKMCSEKSSGDVYADISRKSGVQIEEVSKLINHCLQTESHNPEESSSAENENEKESENESSVNQTTVEAEEIRTSAAPQRELDNVTPDLYAGFSATNSNSDPPLRHVQLDDVLDAIKSNNIPPTPNPNPAFPNISVTPHFEHNQYPPPTLRVEIFVSPTASNPDRYYPSKPPTYQYSSWGDSRFTTRPASFFTPAPFQHNKNNQRVPANNLYNMTSSEKANLNKLRQQRPRRPKKQKKPTAAPVDDIIKEQETKIPAAAEIPVAPAAPIPTPVVQINPNLRSPSRPVEQNLINKPVEIPVTSTFGVPHSAPSTVNSGLSYPPSTSTLNSRGPAPAPSTPDCGVPQPTPSSSNHNQGTGHQKPAAKEVHSPQMPTTSTLSQNTEQIQLEPNKKQQAPIEQNLTEEANKRPIQNKSQRSTQTENATRSNKINIKRERDSENRIVEPGEVILKPSDIKKEVVNTASSSLAPVVRRDIGIKKERMQSRNVVSVDLIDLGDDSDDDVIMEVPNDRIVQGNIRKVEIEDLEEEEEEREREDESRMNKGDKSGTNTNEKVAVEEQREKEHLEEEGSGSQEEGNSNEDQNKGDEDADENMETEDAQGEVGGEGDEDDEEGGEDLDERMEEESSHDRGEDNSEQNPEDRSDKENGDEKDEEDNKKKMMTLPRLVLIEESYSRQIYCALEECESVAKFKCSNCISTIYCSVGCQKSHWWMSHADRCAVIKKLREFLDSEKNK